MHRLTPLFLCATLCSCATQPLPEITSNFLVSNAMLAEPNCLDGDHKEQQVACHRLKPGSSTAVGFRKYQPNKTDMERFEKITVLFPNKVSTNTLIKIDNSNVFATYSFGLSYGPGKKGCVGLANSGNIRLIPQSANFIEIEIDAIIDMKSPSGWKNECGIQHIKQKFIATKREFDSLNTWEGKAIKGSSLITETHPPF